MSQYDQTGLFNEMLIAQPSIKFPIISVKALKKGFIEEVKLLGIWFSDIGINLWEAARSLDSNATIHLEKYTGAMLWKIRIDTLYFSIYLHAKQYYMPMRGSTIDPMAIKIELSGQKNMIVECLKRCFANYTYPPYNFRREKELEKAFKERIPPVY